MTQRGGAEKVVKDIRRATRKQHSGEEKIRIVPAGLRGEDSIVEQGEPGNVWGRILQGLAAPPEHAA